jgi:hypothetical protein
MSEDFSDIKIIGKKKKSRGILHFTEKELSRADWEKIAAIHLSQKEAAILNFMKETNNQPVSTRSINQRLTELYGQKNNSFSQEPLNGRFSKNGLPYRIRRSHSEFPHCFVKIYIVETS